MVTKLHRSSGNVFRDLGFPPDEAEHLQVRSDLMIRLTRILEARGLTQAAAATLLGVTQPRISDLMRGKVDRFLDRTEHELPVPFAPEKTDARYPRNFLPFVCKA